MEKKPKSLTNALLRSDNGNIVDLYSHQQNLFYLIIFSHFTYQIYLTQQL